MPGKKVTILDLQRKKEKAQPITMLTAYDYTGAMLVDKAGMDIILVGDSLGMVMLGYDSTVPVTMAEMLHHCRAVARGAHHSFLVGDMPFMSYQTDVATAVANAGRFFKEAEMDAVKVEGGLESTAAIKAIVSAGMPVMGHIGLTPQSVSKLGGYRVQGKTAASAERLLRDALALEVAGCFAIVLEAIPGPVAETISRRLNIPTIGIGAGVGCDGQVLVFHDVLNLFDKMQPKFVKTYADLGSIILEAFTHFRQDVEARRFPGESHAYPIDPAELDAFLNVTENSIQ